MDRITNKDRRCDNCANVSIIKHADGTEFWACEEYGFYNLGVPANVTPPNNDACGWWTDDPAKANTWMKKV